ncbi:short-chain dehydrogenase [Asanoa ferruginea]|uniref:SDR family NAD(P)-dependent oxidoreductase n=1 Tax=Asanoa ferruginea TaxID=53367 RepID=UPI0019453690|nr:SDR family NAD(P)-dependent oxidoreductase [Asanoa ferruginea]GIF53824.1 short-chain dehydrogenase [Asanoa ferruginea]
MSRAFVTGSSDGIGARIADRLADHGFDVVRHARDERRAGQCRAAGVTDPFVTGDLASLAQTRALAAGLGQFDVVVHNAGWVSRAASRPVTVDGLEQTFQVNALAAYVLTALMPVPRRLVFVSSDSITGARIDLSDLQHERAWTADTAYADSKLAMTAIAFAVARRYPGALCNAVHPGWVSTKMSGDIAPLGLDAGADTAVWLATSTEPAALVTGTFFHERAPVTLNEQADDVAVQDALVARCAELTGVSLHQT